MKSSLASSLGRALGWAGWAMLVAACAEGTSITTGSAGSGGGGTTVGSGGDGTGAGCVARLEECNNEDDDCNGTVDDPDLLNGKPCSSGVPGACSMGETSCDGGVMTCNPTTEPGSQVEVCNGVDDDCNDMVDDLDATMSCPTQFPDATEVTTWTCGAGECQIMACTSAHADLNATVDDGCECATDTYTAACGASAATPVPVGSTVVMKGVVESASGIDWVTFTFADPGVGAAYHPKIELTDTVGGKYKMNVLVDCMGNSAGCSTTGGANNETGVNVTTWEQNYANYIPGAGCCSDNTPRATSIRINVTRANADPPGCDVYTVTASNL